ncbi:MAG: monovalent cation/H(+) antiporter subunit G [Caldilineaceae bacterium]|nr:monovalent cation/H(+) antiporter subunit G [Caldilineaceae bacterium]
MIEWLTLAFLFLGAFFVLVSGIGVIRLPDLFLRMAAITQATTLGVGFIFLAVAFFFDDAGATGRALAAVIFLFLTSPVSAHAIGRAAYHSGVKLWPGTVLDELKGTQKRVLRNS